MGSLVGLMDLLNLLVGEYSVVRKLNLNAWAVSVVDSPLLRVATKPFQTLFEYIRLLITVSDDVVRLESILWHFWASFDTDEVLEFFCEGGHAEVAFIK